MTSVEALARLRALGTPVIETADAAAALRQRASATTKTLKRLADVGLVARVRHGVWWLDGRADPYRLATRITAPYDSYLSLQTALHVHGVIEQIPGRFYLVSLARTQEITTSAGLFSVHHIVPELFGGFEISADGVSLATIEKALFDLAWLSAGRSRIFTHLPEIELPRRLRRRDLEEWIDRIPSLRGRTMVRRKLDLWLSSVKSGP